MVSFAQIWHSTFACYRLPKDSAFISMETPPDWTRKTILEYLGRTVWFFYPIRPEAVVRINIFKELS